MSLTYNTYSFGDLSGAIAHPSLGAYTFSGEGLDSLTIARAEDDSMISLAADGTPLITKVAGSNGALTIVCQQVSVVHKWLLDAYSYLKYIAPASEWAQMTLLVRSLSDNGLHEGTGICFQKKADIPYAKQGQNVTWNLLAGYLFSQNK